MMGTKSLRNALIVAIAAVGMTGMTCPNGATPLPFGQITAVQLFDQENDVAEETDVADKHPEIAAKIGEYLKTARDPLPEWEPKWQAAKKGKK